MQYIRNTIFGVKGYWNFTADGFRRAQQYFDPSALSVSLEGKVIIVTGANSGLGFETAKELAKMKGTVHLVCRNKEKGQEALGKIRKESQNQNIHLHVVDLSDISQTKAFAQSFLNSEKHLHILVNNAGALPSQRIINPQGLDYTFALNTMSTFVLTRELMPLLMKTGESNDPSRVIIVSSGGMYTTPLNSKDLNFQQMNPFIGETAYAQTKRQQVVLTRLFAEKSKTDKVMFFCMHPGWVDTPGVESSLPNFYSQMKSSLRSPSQGADTMIWLAASKQILQDPNLKEANGKFFFDRQITNDHLSCCFTQESEQEREELWNSCQSIYSKY